MPYRAEHTALPPALNLISAPDLLLFSPGTEIAIVLDGSGSIEPEDFQRAKDFISNMMKNFYEKCFEVGFLEVGAFVSCRSSMSM